MDEATMFANLSPLDHRYRHSNPALFEKLSAYLSEEASVRYCLRVEAALTTSHAERTGKLEESSRRKLAAAAEEIDPAEVYEEEEKTQHNVRAIVHVYKRHIPEELRPLVHLGATSVDILDTALAMRMRDVTRAVLLPMLATLLGRLIELVDMHAELPQVGRTHGQFAVPVTAGFTFAEYVARLGRCLPEIDRRAGDLRGKLRGAVGAYNATSLITEDPEDLERQVLKRLDLEPAGYATQIVEPEYLLRLVQEFNVAFGILANLADDLRNLQRSEIAEVQEHFSATQVGSSTMPQKRNPWNSEHVKSLWKAFAPRIMTLYMDQISEHQRDLSNSASMRFLAEYIAGFAAALARMDRIVATLRVDGDRMRENIDRAGGSLLAEPLYILLALSGEDAAHEVIRKLSLRAQDEGRRLEDLVLEDEALSARLREQLRKVSRLELTAFLRNPGAYTGKAAKIARDVADRFRPVRRRYESRTSSYSPRHSGGN
ncbi:MAG: lyase family protein [Spirochaetaceae bacterium]